MKIIFLGTPDFVKPVKDALAQHFTLVDSLQDADLGVVAAYGKILTQKELETPKFGCVNIHPSLLPKYRGPSPIQQAILNGDKTSGVSIIKMDKEVDHGPIIYQEELELSDADNFDILSKKMFLLASDILPQIIKDFVQGKIKEVAQTDTEASYCTLLTRDSGYFDISNPPSPEMLDKMIRAYYPWPGVWTLFRQGSSGQARIVKFLPSGVTSAQAGVQLNIPRSKLDSRLRGNDRESSGNDKESSGNDRESSGNDRKENRNDKFLMQMEGKKAMPIKDFLNGYPDFPLKHLAD